jgi:2-dehydropantoate 2-reductase
MRVAVVGAGQMGSIYGAAAHENGHEVWLIDASQPVVDEINTHGLTIDRRDGHSDVYRVTATTDPGSAGCVADVVLFMVKGWATPQAAERVSPMVAPTTLLLTLQNGLGNEEALRSGFPNNEILIGMSVHTVITVGTAHYAHTGVRDTYIGPSRGDGLESARRAASAFEQPAFPVHVLPEAGIRQEQWAKFVLNCASLPTMALTRLPTPAANDVPLVLAHMDEVTRETCTIAHAEGSELDPEERIAFQHELFQTAGGRASMLGDVLGRRRTEVDTINGAAIRYAEKHGIGAPLNRALFALVKGLEHSFELGEA